MEAKRKTKIEFLDYGPDEQGRRRFILEWWTEAWDEAYCAKYGIKTRKLPGGRRLMGRGQVFFTQPEKHGFTVDGKPLKYIRE
jgi:hypothetical protein